MGMTETGLRWTPTPGAIPARGAQVSAAQWLATATQMRAQGDLLLALWASDEREHGGGFLVRAAVRDAAGISVLALPLPAGDPRFPSLAGLFPAAGRMERAARDLVGACADGGDPRPWLRHAAWPDDVFPLRRDFAAQRRFAPTETAYPFVTVEGDGVHEIPVGPVHAGIIEPGHFRFSIVGEKVLRLEERLGYVHKGIEKRFESLPAPAAHRLAARVSGDSAVASSWSYCMALEGLCGRAPPRRALWLRALALERERIANHLGDLGALGNDAGFAFGLAQFSRLKEDLLRANAAAFGSRYLMDYVVPMGVASDLDAHAVPALLAHADALEPEVRRLRAIYDDHAGVQDRFVGAGRVRPELAAQLGLTGLAGRASGQARDARCDLGPAPYDELAPRMIVHPQGDVAARVSLRFDELFESLRLCRRLLRELPAGAVRGEAGAVPEHAAGVGCVEGWRGPLLVALDTGPQDSIRRCHVHDPSWQNWPLLEHAIIDNIVPDFPLINKSFNLSYSGHDL
jgi:Ni,Fe-hydrogenase III large subunit/Ni,Fe-hydrogenase III component G